ncbi:DUF5623 domain-containing protein [Pseudomonas fluorescens]|uniref:DUF5623 domain-containing protein n=1 Tax=Pseudomonas fluorescens TaxID=294 RepID=A0A944HAV2_PSEFL|nr:DUF5623 domain-containing protein [Pseudomonas fluorescens]MBT2298216.1 DUF5623 domain-containing protein [Pseudomonas fluorescens]MBT2309661.1 DUF5623 domain-containing protein [Pseudomonas fluorescens]MBT2314824.1 DUF5623 domain-containing protein [Pseudomonas fluorescens]MBT2327730.1 DUF5623 domain-containing protein [Pseudomonas fluorescens]MBT2345477.1 DUF5623 domain-containing protein [Pseudomonas fluorescens]
MSITLNACPSTLDGIKRKAKRIGREHQLPHLAALELAAKQSGYESYQHARKTLQNELRAPLLHSIFLSAYWRDSSTEPRSNGLEILEVKLPRPLLNFLSKHQCDYAQGLKAFFVECSDHLEMRSNADSQARAQELLMRAALSLQFIEATGLRPATTKAQIAAAKAATELPSADHVSRWICSETGSWLMLDEPYDHVSKPAEHERRNAWVQTNGLVWAKPSWQGLYNPGHALPHFVTSDSDLLVRMVGTVEKIPVLSNALSFRSEPFNTQFLSPAREQSGRRRKPRPGTSFGYSKNAIEYHWKEGWASQWRPNQRMSLENHKEMGWTLKRLYVSATPIGAHSKLLELQSELENWMYAEYRGQNRREVDVDIYYGGHDIPRYATRAEMVAAVDHLRSIMVGTYLDSKPLRDQLKKLDAARGSIAMS